MMIMIMMMMMIPKLSPLYVNNNEYTIMFTKAYYVQLEFENSSFT